MTLITGTFTGKTGGQLTVVLVGSATVGGAPLDNVTTYTAGIELGGAFALNLPTTDAAAQWRLTGLLQPGGGYSSTITVNPATGSTQTLASLDVGADVGSISPVSLTTGVSGVLPVANGGNGFTNKTSGVQASRSDDGIVYIKAPYAMTLAAPTTQPGTATVTGARAPAASPTAFVACVYPQAFAVNDVLRLTFAGVVTYETATLLRTA